jgi:ribosomal protein S18 acetylase RimI-like enzyme
MDTQLLQASAEDAEEFRQISIENFVESFGASYPSYDLEYFLRVKYSLAKQRALLEDPRYGAFIMRIDGKAVGHALAGPCGLPHSEVAADDGEIMRMYVLKQYHNAGLGRQLMDRAMEFLLKSGPRTLWLGVWSQNLAAQRFYARYDFQHVGEYFFEVGHTRDHEFIMRRSSVVSHK